MGTNYFPAADISELKREQQIMLVLAWYPAVFVMEKSSSLWYSDHQDQRPATPILEIFTVGVGRACAIKSEL
jgi:hypothetical protein